MFVPRDALRHIVCEPLVLHIRQGVPVEVTTNTNDVREPGVASRRSRPDERGGARGDGAPRDGAENLANALGWFSVGLGLAQIVAPRSVARMIGAEPDENTTRLMRAFGLRELSSGIGILSKRRPEAWVRARVAGDALDLAMLGKTLASTDDRGKTIAATVAVLGVTALDMLAAERLGKHTQSRSEMMGGGKEEVKHVRRAITIRRSPDEVAAFWRQMGGDDEALGESVRFVPAPGGRGTEVHLDRTYKSPGRIAKVIATFKHDSPAQHEFDELFALKQILETGDTVVSDAWLNGPGKMHPAQPDAAGETTR
jgi:uncharacterized membrane protein